MDLCAGMIATRSSCLGILAAKRPTIERREYSRSQSSTADYKDVCQHSLWPVRTAGCTRFDAAKDGEIKLHLAGSKIECLVGRCFWFCYSRQSWGMFNGFGSSLLSFFR